jgi:hypothetical protein
MVPLPPNVFTRILIPVACTKYLVFFYENFCQEETSTKRSSFLNRYFHVLISQLHLIIIGCRTEIFDMEKIMIKLFKSGIVPAPIRGSIRKTLLCKIYVFRTNAALLCLIFPNSSFSRLTSLVLPPDKNTRISKNLKLFKWIIVHCRVNLFDLRQGNQ